MLKLLRGLRHNSPCLRGVAIKFFRHDGRIPFSPFLISRVSAAFRVNTHLQKISIVWNPAKIKAGTFKGLADAVASLPFLRDLCLNLNDSNTVEQLHFLIHSLSTKVLSAT